MSESELKMELSTLVKQRGIIKGRLTRFEQYVKELTSLKDIPALKYKELELKTSKIQSLISEFEEIQNKIDILHSDPDEQIQEREMLENKFINVIAISQELLDNSGVKKETDHNDQFSNKVPDHKHKTNTHSKSFVAAVDKKVNKNECLVCKEIHPLYLCDKFKGMTVDERLGEITKFNLCKNCFRSGHNAYQCKLKAMCRTCKKKHNTLVHVTQTENSEQPSTSSLPVSLSVVSSDQVLLSTALIQVVKDKKTYTARALLDTGSQSSFITDSLKEKLGLVINPGGQEHERLFHAGPQHLLASIRERFWAIGGRNLARSTTKKCLLCARFRGKTIQPIMGNLPSERTYSMFPFYTCGVDFAGPFTISSRKGRGSQSSKCYLCLFVCLSTKAIHLELVSSLSSDAFILSLKRFISRRGKPSVIYCDNGTNFRGANNEMSRVLRSNQKIRQDFWQRWRREFVAELQQRTKWKTRQHELRVGDLVILKEENVPPLQWRLGRVTRLYPGTDGVSRVADVMSSRGIVRRAVNKMCILPSSAPADTTLINDDKDAAENKEA
ncbi:hypothetical protein HF086_008734 [Spodoptera exigua]|uniref:DUF5641 domain-containing protein n=1 Tax=Spodoptera exigua TaxID=7107 RepID=A0A922SKV3_SPOEX|nr:hypothetical protein HF086_008734 [Spodoptera exigua]